MGQRLQELLNWVKSGPAVVPGAVEIPAEQTDLEADKTQPFKAREHYFTVRINEMFLSEQRKWFVTSVPMVYVQTELRYGTEPISVPFVVGPSLVGNSGQRLPQGMLFQDTRVAGVYPYMGDKLTLTVILNRLVKENYAEQLLGLLSGLGSTFDVSTALSPYLRVANVIVDGLESLLGLGNEPELGRRQEFDTNAGDEFKPGFFALLSKDISPSDRLWVRGRRLFAGPDQINAAPIRDRDYVLYSITQTPRRDDIESLPWFAHLWERVVQQAGRGSADGLESAIADMQTLGQEIYLSADLSQPQKLELINLKKAEMFALHDATVSAGHRAAAESVTEPGLDLETLSGIVRSMRQRP